MSEVPAADWGTRAYIYLYRMEPFTNRLASGNVTHIKKYFEPIDEDRVMHEEGSGKYRAILNYRKPGTNSDSELERVEFEILNEKFPPNIPSIEQVWDDPRNKKWAWAKALLEAKEAAKHAAPPVQSAQAGIVETLKVFSEIQDAADDRAAAKTNGQPSFVDTIKAVKELLPNPAPPQTENALLSTIVTLMTAQTTAAQEEARELRKEIREMRTQPAQQNGNGLGGIKDFVAAAKELLPTLKEVFPGAADKVDGMVSGGRSRMTGSQELAVEIARAVMPALQPAVPYLIQRLFTPPPHLGGPPHQNPALPPGTPQQQPGSQGGPPAPPPDPMIGFINNITPSMLYHFRLYAGGSEDHDGFSFYDSVLGSYGPLWMEKDWHTEAKATGVLGLVGLYKQSGLWAELAPNESKFVQFVTDFLNATPEEDDKDEVIDLTTGEPDANV